MRTVERGARSSVVVLLATWYVAALDHVARLVSHAWLTTPRHWTIGHRLLADGIVDYGICMASTALTCCVVLIWNLAGGSYGA